MLYNLTYKKKNDPNDKFASPNAPESNSHELFDDCTVLFEGDYKNIIVVDFDEGVTPARIECILNHLGIVTQWVETTRGVHVYFNKPRGCKYSKDATNFLGIKCEYKYKANTPNGINVKSNGILRTHHNAGVFADLPDAFKPMKLQSGDMYNLAGLVDGDERQPKLVRHWFKIRKAIPDPERIIWCINTCVFGEPKSVKEIESVINAKGNGQNEPKDLETVIQEVTLFYEAVSYKGELYLKIDSKYTNDVEKIKRTVDKDYRWLSTGLISEVISKVQLRATFIEDIDVLAFANGFIQGGKVYHVPYTGFTPHTLEWEYDVDAPYNETVEQLLEVLTDGDESYRKYILQMLAYPLIVDRDFKRINSFIFIIIGDGGNGKGTFMEMAKMFYGDKNASNIKLDKFCDRTFMVGLDKKIVNLGDDIKNKPIDDDILESIKSVSSGDTITTRGMYSSVGDYKFYATLIFTSNHLLKSFEKGTSWERRVKWLPMFGKPKVKDKRFVSKLISNDAMQYLFKIVLEEVGELYENIDMTHCEKVESYTHDYHLQNNNVNQYIDDLDRDINRFINVYTKTLYESYEAWCESSNDSKPLGKTTFLTTIKNELNLRNGRVRNVQNRNEQISVLLPNEEVVK